MKILLIGKTGQLGHSILNTNKSHEIFAPERNICDLENELSFKTTIDSFKPDVVINTAAFHNVPMCEVDYISAFAVNTIAIRNLALACKKANILFVTFSTDYVFDGEKKTPYTENDPPNPLQIYGISKLAGEFSAKSVAPQNTIIIRTSGLYGIIGAKSKGGNFIDKRIDDAKKSKNIEIGCEQLISPTFTDDLACAVFKLIEHPDCKSGIYHLVNQGECSWYDLTKSTYEILQLDTKVVPVDRNCKSGEMRRPKYSVLANTNAKALGIELPYWRDALERYIKLKYGNNFLSK